MHAGGVGFRRLVIPIVVFGLLVSVLTATLNEYVAPPAEKRADTIVLEATMRAGEGLLEEGVFRARDRQWRRALRYRRQPRCEYRRNG